MRTVPLLLTLDLEVAYDHDLAQQSSILERLGADLARLQIPVTIFATATAAEAFSWSLRRLVASGHEIACHGLTHGIDDDYRRMAPAEARRCIGEATSRVAEATGARPQAFRGPCMTTSPATQEALLEHGYLADFSVCSQRLDFWRSRGGSVGWLRAPRAPYLPSSRSPYRRGGVPLVVVPLSCLGLPFLSGALYLLGLPFMKAIFRLLLAEAGRSGKPIVYLFHSYEFVRFLGEGNDRRPFHQRLYLRDPDLRYVRNLALLRHMTARRTVTARTAIAFVGDWLGDLAHGSSCVQVPGQAPGQDSRNPALPHPLRE